MDIKCKLCKHSNHEEHYKPCRNCYEYEHWEPIEQPKPERPSKDCHLCRYENRNNIQQPCKECLTKDCRVWLPKDEEGQNKAIMRQAIEHYGMEHQILKAFEELGELIVGLRNRDIPNITEEIADVRNMLDQLEMMFEIDTDEVEKIRKEKMAKVRKEIDGK
jgi:hypothetical protein